MFRDEIDIAVRKEMNTRFPYEELSYRNMVIAGIIANGHKDKLTEDWLRRALLEDIADGFMTYGQVITIKDDYFKVINEIKARF